MRGAARQRRQPRLALLRRDEQARPAAGGTAGGQNRAGQPRGGGRILRPAADRSGDRRRRRPRRLGRRRRSRLGAGSDWGEPAMSPELEGNADLTAQRDRLLEKFTIMQADLGGAFYEMAIRDHVRMDVLTRKAAELQRVDAELLAAERMLELLQ